MVDGVAVQILNWDEEKELGGGLARKMSQGTREVLMSGLTTRGWLMVSCK